MNTIEFKGISSTTIDGLIICELPPISKPPMRVSQTEIDGRHGTIFEELGYSAYNKSVEIGLKGNFDINKVIKYFSGEGDIVFSNEPDKVYHGIVTSQIDYNRLIRFRKAKVTFRVQPFKHKKNEAMKETEIATATSTSIVVNDSAEANLSAFSIYGKSTQNGTPTPDAPIDIVSLGENRNINVKLYGKNIVNLENGAYVLSSGTPSDTASSYQRTTKFNIPKGRKLVWSDSNGTTPTDVLQWKENGEYIGTYSYTNGGFDAVSTEAYWVAVNYYLGNRARLKWCQIEIGNVATPYNEFKTMQSTAFANALRGIPVTDKSLATYTDASGQMWCADEIDLERGVYVQRIHRRIMTGTETISRHDEPSGNYYMMEDTQLALSKDANALSGALCSHLKEKTPNALWSAVGDAFSLSSTSHLPIRFRIESATTINAVKNLLANWYAEGNPMVIVYRLATPIETPLTEEQIAICKSLKANEPTTTILNDENAFMKVAYFKPFEVFNEGLEESKPLMILRGNGIVEIKVNGIARFTYTFPEGENEVYIDSEIEEAYLGVALKNRNMLGEFPVLVPKSNKIEWSGDVESIEILPRSRWL